MIKSEAEYKAALVRISEDRDFGLNQKTSLEAMGLNPEEIERAMEPLTSFHAQLVEEVSWYEDVRRRNFAPIDNLTRLGRTLIGLRIANGLSQRELAERLGVSDAVVSRDERNEYHNITVERAQKIIDTLQASVRTIVTDKIPFISYQDVADSTSLK